MKSGQVQQCSDKYIKNRTELIVDMKMLLWKYKVAMVMWRTEKYHSSEIKGGRVKGRKSGRNDEKKKRGKEVEEKAREREMQKKGNEEKEW